MSRRRRMQVETLEDRRMLAVSFTGNYSQDFNSLPTSGTIVWANDTTLDGWYLFSQPAPGTAITSVASGTGSSAVGSFYNFGVNGAGPLTDRALGGVGSGDAYFGSPATESVAGWMALALTNDTGNTIDEIYLNYTGEKWRWALAGTDNQTMVVEFGFGASFDLVPSWTSLGSDFNFRPSVNISGGARDGNAAANRTPDIDGKISDLGWSIGNTLWLRWVEKNDTGNDHGLAIDDVQINTLPTLVVDTLVDESDGDFSAGDLSLREALENAQPFSKIVFDPSLTSGGPATILLTQDELTIDQSLIIDGPGADLLTIDASGNDPTPAVDNGDGSRVILISDGDYYSYLSVAISGLTITGADNSNGAILSSENFELHSSVVTGNHATYKVIDGGYGDFVIKDSEITDNSANRIITGYDIEIKDSTVSNNTGSAVFLGHGSLNISDSTISGNTADRGAGIFLSYQEGDSYFPGMFSTATITNTLISGNTAMHSSAIYSKFGRVTLVDSIVSGNLATTGAAIGISSDADEGYMGTLALLNTDVVDNDSDGVIVGTTSNAPGHEVWIVESNISGNNGTGLRVSADVGEGTVEIIDSSFNNNTRGMHLIGLDFGDKELIVNIERSEILNNTTGGGLLLRGSGQIDIVDSTISGNHNTVEDGGGITARYYYSYASLRILGSTISGNTTVGSGGGIFFGGNALTIEDSTISGNSADSYGGGVWNYTVDAPASITRTTIAHNSAGVAGGGLHAATDYSGLGAVVSNSIIANNTAATQPDVVMPDDATINYSLIENPGTMMVGGTGNVVGVDPMLGPLQDNGGPTLTHSLLAGSPAIDAGDPGFTSPPDYDQRGEGFDRVEGGRIDMGAYEVQAAASLPGDYNGDGVVTGRDFLAWQRGESPDPFSGDDLETWQEEYNGGALSALSMSIEDEYGTYEDDEETSPNLMIMLPTTPPAAELSSLGGSPGGFELSDLFVESVDLALEELSAISTYGVREFGELVARRRPMYRPVLN